MIRRCVIGLVCSLATVPAGLAEDQTFDSNGVQIHYVVEGKGEPVLLIHDFTKRSYVQWEVPKIIKALSKDYQVIAFDNRGHGKSGKPHDPAKYGMEMVNDAVRLLDHLKIKKAHVVGYCMGSMIACKLLTTHPDRVLSATLGGGGGLRDGADLALFDQLGDSLEQGNGIGIWLEALTPPGTPKPMEKRIKVKNAFLDALNDTKALAAVVRSFKDITVSDVKLKANRVPTLALIGDMDPMKKSVDELKGPMANLKVVVIDGADHHLTCYSPAFMKSLQNFLAEHSQKAKTPGAKAESGK